MKGTDLPCLADAARSPPSEVSDVELSRDEDSVLEGPREGGDVDSGEKGVQSVVLKEGNVGYAAPAVAEATVFDVLAAVTRVGEHKADGRPTDVEEASWDKGGVSVPCSHCGQYYYQWRFRCQ